MRNSSVVFSEAGRQRRFNGNLRNTKNMINYNFPNTAPKLKYDNLQILEYKKIERGCIFCICDSALHLGSCKLSYCFVFAIRRCIWELGNYPNLCVCWISFGRLCLGGGGGKGGGGALLGVGVLGLALCGLRPGPAAARPASARSPRAWASRAPLGPAPGPLA